MIAELICILYFAFGFILASSYSIKKWTIRDGYLLLFVFIVLVTIFWVPLVIIVEAFHFERK